MGATLSSKKIYNSFLGKYDEHKHLFHGHTFTGNPLAAAVACKNIQLYKKERLLEKVARISKRLKSHADLFYNIENVGDVRTGGLLMGIEMVSDRRTKIPIRVKGTSINKIVFDEGRKNGIYLRTLGNVVMLVPPLAISKSVLDTLVEKTEENHTCSRTKIIIKYSATVKMIYVWDLCTPARMVFSVFSTSVSSTLFEIARGGTSITTLPNVRRYIPFFLPSSKTILLMDVPFTRIGIFVRLSDTISIPIKSPPVLTSPTFSML